jgi:hypothetical protein
MIAPEYFNNHVAVEGEIIVKSVPNDAGFVLVWNPTTKKISRRTHAEIAADLNLVTTNTLALYHKRDPAFALNNASDTHTNQTWFDYNWAGTGKSGSVINVSGFGGDYSTELFATYNDYYAAIRSRQGDYSQWNDPMVLWHNKNFNPANYQPIGSYVTLDTDQSIDGKKTYNAYFDSYTSDGLFNSNARTLKINTPSANKILFGYKDYGGGQYYSRIGFLNNGLTNWSAGPLGNNFVIGINNDGVETFRIHPSGATSSIASNTQVFQRVYQGAYPDTTHQTGMLVLKMPQASIDQAMFSIDINVYGYESQYLGKINVSFYKYVSGLIIQNGSKALFNVTENFPTNVARVGIGSDGLVSIILGQPDTFWGSYTSFEVERVQIHYANYYQDWSNGWSHALETDLSVYGNNIIVLPTDVTATKSWVTGNLNTQLGNYWAKSSTAGYTGIDTSTPFAVLNAGYAQKVYMGGLLVSDAYQDEGNVPAQGAYIKGNIVGNSNIDIANRLKAQKLVGNYQGTTSGQNLGSAGIGSTLELRNYDLYGTNFWTDDNGWGFIQQQRFDGNPVAYDLRLQPFGGLLLYGANEVATVNQLPNMSNYIPITHPSYSLTQNNVDYLVYMTNTGMASLADLLNYIPLSQKGVANGVATLDSSGLVPATQLPSYVDDVLEFANLASFPATGESGKIYVETDTNQTYRWSGSTYIQIASGAVQSVNGQTGIVNVTKADVGLGNADNTSDVNKPISTATQTALDGKENSFSKNTAFNKNFGTVAGTIAEGNDSRINNGQIAYNWGNHQAINEGQYLGNAGQYSITSDTSVGDFPQGIASYFVQADSVYPSYGSLLNIKTYNGGGGTLQLYTPYSTQYGGDFIKYRRYNYGTEAWSDLRGFWDTGHFSPTDLASWNNVAAGNSTGYIRTDTLEQTKTGKLTLGSGLAIPDQEKIYLAGYANTADYVARFADAFVGFSISNGFAVKHSISGGDLFKVDDEGNIHNTGAAYIASTLNTPKLIANYPASTSGQNLGSSGTGSTLELRNYNAYGTNFWTDDSGQGYIQQQRFDGNPSAYRLNLQPLGGELFYGDSEVAKQSWVNANDRNFITDSRGAVRPPSFYDDRYAQWDFQYTDDTQVTGDAWQGVLTVAKWSTFDPSHRQEQLLFTGDNLKRRTAIDDNNWGPEKIIWDSGNFTPANYVTASQLNDKVNKSGDAMSGALLIGNSTIGKQRVLHLAEPTYLDSYGFNFYTDTSTGLLTLHALNNGLNNAAPILSANRVNNFVGINKENPASELDVNGLVTSNGFIKNNSSDDYFLMGGGGQLTKYSKDDAFINSGRDFTDGTLITTNIDYSQTQGESFLLEIKGNMYGGGIPMDTKVQGYIYADTIINHSGYSTYSDLTTIVAMNINGNLCFWFPRLWYWQGFSVKAITTGGGGMTTVNRVVSIDNSVEPIGTKQVKITVYTLSTQSWVNNQGFLTSANLNGYVTQSSLNSQLGSYATLNGVQTFNNTNTFNQSPVIPNGTLGNHAVNLNQLLDIAAPYYWNYVGQPAILNRRVLSEMTWNNYGNGHTIFDISSGTTPWGTSKSNVDAEQPWSPSYPTLVGGNGSETYGVRVDSARNADNLGGIPAGNYATQTWVNTNFIPKSHPVYNITQANINSWNASAGGSSHTHSNLFYLDNIDQYLGTGQAPQFGSIRLMDSLGYGLLALEEGFIGGEIGLVDISNKRFYAGRINEYLKYGSSIDGFEGLNIHFDSQLLGIGREIGNDEDKVQLSGNLSVDTTNIFGSSVQLILNPLYNTDGDVRRSRNAHIYIVTGNSVRLPDKPILGQRIEIFNDSDSEIEVAHSNAGTMFYVPRLCKVTGVVGARGFIFDEKPLPAKKYDVY